MLGAAVEGEKSGPIAPQEKAAIFSKSAAARRGMRWRAAYLRSACGARDAQSNKLVEDSAGRLRPTAAARMNGNSLLSKLDKRYGQEAGCSGAPARRRPGGRHGRRSLGRSTALTHEALACAGRAATPPRVKNARKSEKIRYFPPGGSAPRTPRPGPLYGRTPPSGPEGVLPTRAATKASGGPDARSGRSSRRPGCRIPSLNCC